MMMSTTATVMLAETMSWVLDDAVTVTNHSLGIDDDDDGGGDHNSWQQWVPSASSLVPSMALDSIVIEVYHHYHY